MKYILTEEEYEKLKKDQLGVSILKSKKFQEFCTLAANKIPVKRPWDENGEKETPWGCIINNADVVYCDLCPAIKFCQYEHKNVSP